MKAVFEEVNGDYAVLLLEDLNETYVINLEQLPAGAKIGDIFQVQLSQQKKIQFGQKLTEEGLRRTEVNRRKREALKKRRPKN